MVPFKEAEKAVYKLENIVVSPVSYITFKICLEHPREIQQAFENMEPEFRSEIETGGNPGQRSVAVC